jgi:hypothetical protein
MGLIGTIQYDSGVRHDQQSAHEASRSAIASKTGYKNGVPKTVSKKRVLQAPGKLISFITIRYIVRSTYIPQLIYSMFKCVLIFMFPTTHPTTLNIERQIEQGAPHPGDQSI